MVIALKDSAIVKRDGRVIFVKLKPLALVTATIVACVSRENAIAEVDMEVFLAREKSAHPTALSMEHAFEPRSKHQVLPCNATAIKVGQALTVPCQTVQTTAATTVSAIMEHATATASGKG
jgi:hypothetical protein